MRASSSKTLTASERLATLTAYAVGRPGARTLSGVEGGVRTAEDDSNGPSRETLMLYTLLHRPDPMS